MNMNNMNMNNINMNNIKMNNMNINNMNNMNMNNMNMNNMNINNMNMNNMNNMNMNMNNNNSFNNRNNTNKDEPPKELIQRGDKFFQFTGEFPFENQTALVNIYLHASSGLKVMLAVPFNITLKELFKLYAKKIGIGESLLGKEIIFLFNALTINVNEEKTLFEYFTHGFNQITITVIDQNNVIGANKI